MAIIRCPFHVISPGEPARPMLPVKITNPATGQYVCAWGLIDTGADDCALPASFAPLLGHRLRAGKPRRISTGNGVAHAYAHMTRIDIFARRGGSWRSRVAYTVAATPMDFLPHLDCVLIGATSFLSRFILNIDYPGRHFSIRCPARSCRRS